MGDMGKKPGPEEAQPKGCEEGRFGRGGWTILPLVRRNIDVE